MEEPNILETETNRLSDNNGRTADQTKEVPMEIVKDDEVTPDNSAEFFSARLGIKDFDDENEEILRLTVEEAHNYILSKVEIYLKDPEFNELLNLKNQIETLNSRVQEQEKEVGKLTRLFGTLCRDQEKFLRHTGVIPNVETNTIGVSVNLPWLPETLSNVANEDMLNQTGNSRIFLPPLTEISSKVPKKASNEPVECIDLTDDADNPGSSNSGSATTESKAKFADTPSTSSAVSNSVTSSILPKTKPITPSEKSLQHPAPLPAIPDGKDESKVPPKPRLKISVDKTGIILQWDLPPEAKDMKIMGFEIFGYQEKNNVPISSALWKKIGRVDPLALPMSCTLTQFMEGFKYHFSIRAFCKDDNFGAFSDPASVTFVP